MPDVGKGIAAGFSIFTLVFNNLLISNLKTKLDTQDEN